MTFSRTNPVPSAASPVSSARRAVWARFLALAMGPWLLTVVALEAQDPGEANPRQQVVQRLIGQLDADRFREREEATRQLIALGPDAISAVEASVRSGSAEARVRGIHVLRAIAMDENPIEETPARAALERLLNLPIDSSRHRVTLALRELDRVRESRTLAYLEERGAVKRDDIVLVDQRYPTFGGYALVLGDNWSGNLDDLSRFRFLTDLTGIQVTGDWVDDAQVEQIARSEQIRLISIRNASITDTAVAALVRMGKLEGLELRYCPVDNQSIVTFKRFQFLSKLRLIGTRVSKQGADDLIESLGESIVDYRMGGFLGVSCDSLDERCRVFRVVENSAAQEADIRVNDVIQRVDDTPIQTADEVIETLSMYSVGDKVTITWSRGDESFTKEIELREFADLN